MKAIDGFLRELGREKSDSYRALYIGLGWFLTVSLGFLAVVLQRLGKTDVSCVDLWVLVIALSITLKYFLRLLQDYINMQAWSRLFNTYTLMLGADTTEERTRLEARFGQMYQLYVIEWKSPIPLRKAFEDAMRIGYVYLILIELGFFIYVLWELGYRIMLSTTALMALAVLAEVVVWELGGLNYRRYQFAEIKEPPQPSASAAVAPGGV